jgi:broad specificity phosphatase PhoE
VLSNRHHYRHADHFASEFGIPVLAVEEGMHEFGGHEMVKPFAFGDSPAPQTTVYPIQSGWPDEGAVHITVGPGLLLLADSAMHYGEELSFVPDQYIGEDVEGEKRRLREGLAKLLELEFDVLLVGHGTPIATGGKDALAKFVQAGG